jgi:hypothetical protein
VSPEAERAAWAAQHRDANQDLLRRSDAAFDALLARAELDPQRLARRPHAAAWSGAEILEHVALMDRFVLVLVEKIAARTRARLARGEPWPTAPPDLARVAQAALEQRAWPHPPHMAPAGALTPSQSAAALARDRARCRAWLAEFPAGEGTLHRIRMSRVEGEDRLELYQFLELVARHAQRHAAQLDRAAAGP